MKIPDVAIAPWPLREPAAAGADSAAAGTAAASPAAAPSDAGGAGTAVGTSAAQADDALGKINATLQLSSVNVRFEIDQTTDRLITKVVDIQSGKVIRQIPSEVAIRISKALDKLQGLLVHEQS
jgi:flagellar protein FlaG